MRKLLFLFILLCSYDLSAQTCCSGGVPISGSLGLSTGSPKSVQVLLSYDHNMMRSLFTESERLDDRSRWRANHSLLLEVGYTFHPRISVSVLASGIRQERVVYTAATDLTDKLVNQGIGDGLILLKYAILQKDRALWMLGAGPKIPLGRTDAVDADEFILPADLQAGSGAWDGLFWTLYSQSPNFRPSMNFSVQATARITGINRNYNEIQHYQFGNEYQVSVGIADQFLIGKLLVDPSLLIRYRHASADRTSVLPASIPITNIPSTGGHWLTTIPGLAIHVTPRMAVRFSGTLPIFQRLTGTQISTSYKWKGAIFWELGG